MCKRYFWIKQDERTGWEPALMDRFGHYWPIGDDGWVTEKDLLQLGPEMTPPPDQPAQVLSIGGGKC